MLSHTISTRDVAQALRDHVRQLERRNAQLEQQLANRTIDRLLAQRRPTAGPEDNPADDEQPDEEDWDAWECEQTGQPPSRPRPSEIDRLHAAIVSAEATLKSSRQNHFAAGAEPEPPTQLPVPPAPAVSFVTRVRPTYGELEQRVKELEADIAVNDRLIASTVALLKDEVADKDRQLTRSCAKEAKAVDAVYKWREWSDKDESRPVQCEGCSRLMTGDEAKAARNDCMCLCVACASNRDTANGPDWEEVRDIR